MLGLCRMLRRDLSDASTRVTPSWRGGAPLDTLAWGRKYLAAHFAKPASGMHEWLSHELAEISASARSKVNLIGPRGGAKSTIATLCYVLQAAVEGWEPYIWIVSDTKQQAQTHLENVKAELVDNPILAHDYPHAVGRGPRWQAASIELANGVVIESFGTGQRIRGRRRRAASADAHRLRRSAERQPHLVGRAARVVAALVSRHAAQGRHQADQRRQPGDGAASRRTGAGAARGGRLDVGAFRRDRIVADEPRAVERVGGDLLRRRTDPERQGRRSAPARLLPMLRQRSEAPRKWTPAPSCCGRRRKTSTR